MLKTKNLQTAVSSDADKLPFLMQGISSGQEISMLPLETLEPAPDEWNFYRSLSKDKLLELAVSIEKNGLLHPVVVWEDTLGNKIILSGHNRVEAFRLLYEHTKDSAFLSIPCTIKTNLDEGMAREIIIDSNWVQRTLTPSERTKSIYQKYVIMGRKKRSKPLDGYERSVDIIAKDFNLSGKQVQRYIKLNKLIPSFMDMMDQGTITLRMGLVLCDLPKTVQEKVFDYINKDKGDVSSLRLISKNMSIEQIENLLFDHRDRNDTEPIYSPADVDSPDIITVSFNIPAHLKTKFVMEANLILTRLSDNER